MKRKEGLSEFALEPDAKAQSLEEAGPHAPELKAEIVQILVEAPPQDPKAVEVFVALTVAGPQTSVFSKVNNGIVLGIMQMVFISSLIPHRFPVINLIVYVPGVVNLGTRFLLPEIQEEGRLGLGWEPNELPLCKVQPVAGDISQTNFASELQFPELLTSDFN